MNTLPLISVFSKPWPSHSAANLSDVLLSLGFSIKNLASDKQKMIGSLKAIGAFLVVLVVAYLFSSGEETPLQDGEFLSASGARWVETGIRMFYFLTVIAVGAMAFGSVRKLIKK